MGWVAGQARARCGPGTHATQHLWRIAGYEPRLHNIHARRRASSTPSPWRPTLHNSHCRVQTPSSGRSFELLEVHCHSRCTAMNPLLCPLLIAIKPVFKPFFRRHACTWEPGSFPRRRRRLRPMPRTRAQAQARESETQTHATQHHRHYYGKRR